MTVASMDQCPHWAVVQEDQRESSARKTGLGNSPAVIRKVCFEEKPGFEFVDQYQ